MATSKARTRGRFVQHPGNDSVIIAVHHSASPFPARFRMNQLRLSLIVAAAITNGASIGAANNVPVVDLSRFDPACGIEIDQVQSQIRVSWPISDRQRGRMRFDLTTDQPLVRSVEISSDGEAYQQLAGALDPTLRLRVGRRDLDRRGGWTIFFDRMQEKPHELFPAEGDRSSARATSQHRRATLIIGDVTAGPFRGHWQWTFYAGNPLVLQEAVLATERDGVAYLFDFGLECHDGLPESVSWQDSHGRPQTSNLDGVETPIELAVRGRAICAEYDNGSIVLFPPPHRFFYPLDFSDNLKNVWIGPDYVRQGAPFGFGVRHDPRGDNRFVPWFNAPPGTAQQLSVFLQLGQQPAAPSLQAARQWTRSDHYKPLAGYQVFSSHYHVEHTRDLLEQQQQPAARDDTAGTLGTGEEYRIPERLRQPGFVRTFRRMGVDIVHLAEFHFGQTPRMTEAERVERLQLLHAECNRLSDAGFLLLPGEEPNVHLGGHWISFFPTPVYWVLNRADGEPFVQRDPKLGNIYHVGSPADVLRLLRAEKGLAWTAHPRIKGSTGFPDRYREQLFFQSDRFLGAAWKAMPADLSQPQLGKRVLDLLDDMSNWGNPKYVLGEVDVFKIQPDHELYGHMNVNYVRLNEIPRFGDGWQPLLDALSDGQFFVTTGEVLIPQFTVNGVESGHVASVNSAGQVKVQFDLEWTYPLSHAEIVMGDGRQTERQRIDLAATSAFGDRTVAVEVDASDQRWLRLEVWDIATNGAFTQPIWLESAADF